jgi:hypothetical protein
MDMNMNTNSNSKVNLTNLDMTKEEYEKWQARKRLMRDFLASPRLPAAYADPNYDPDYKLLREAAYRERGLIP